MNKPLRDINALPPSLRSEIACLLIIGFLLASSFEFGVPGHLKNAASLDSPLLESEIDFSIVSYNVWGLPIWSPKYDKKKRFPFIGEAILKLKPDIVCMQETFDRNLRSRLVSSMMDTYNLKSDHRCNSKLLGFPIKDCYGGLMTLSKFPIHSEEFIKHNRLKEMRIDERIGEKGSMITQLSTPIGLINIINIHLYAGRSYKDELIRLDQVKYLHQIIRKHNLLDYPTFITGDFNIVHPSVSASSIEFDYSKVYSYLVDSMDFTDTVEKLDEEAFTYDHLQNPYAVSSEKSQKLDYCMYKMPEGFNIELVSSEVVFKGERPLSDHFGLLSRFKISRKEL